MGGRGASIGRPGAGKFNNATPEQFAKAIAEAKKYVDPEAAWRVTAYGPEKYEGAKLHVTAKGSTIAVKPDGDIVSLCRRSGDPLRGKDLIALAIKNGGTKLDSFAGNHEYYQKMQFKPVSWCKWVHKYRPGDWKKEYNPEHCIFYVRSKTPITKIETAKEFYKRVKPSKGYDQAQKARDNYLKENK